VKISRDFLPPKTCFQNGDFCRRRLFESGEVLFVFIQRKNNNVLVDKMKIQKRTLKRCPGIL
jgi:hypothetical protein